MHSPIPECPLRQKSRVHAKALQNVRHSDAFKLFVMLMAIAAALAVGMIAGKAQADTFAPNDELAMVGPKDVSLKKALRPQMPETLRVRGACENGKLVFSFINRGGAWTGRKWLRIQDARTGELIGGRYMRLGERQQASFRVLPKPQYSGLYRVTISNAQSTLVKNYRGVCPQKTPQLRTAQR